MTWDDFYKSIKAGDYQSVYLFSGPEEWNKREALNALRKALLPAGLEQLNESIMEGVSARDIIDAAETLPVMCDRRLVVVRDWSPFLPSKGKASEEKDVDIILEWMKTMPDSCVLVFYMMQEPDSRKKLTKKLKETAGSVEFSFLSGSILHKWCNQQLKPHGKKIAHDAMNEMSMMAGQELTRLNGELLKLAAYVEDRSEITVDDVRTVVSPSPEYTVFMILDKLLEGNLTEATLASNAYLMLEPKPSRLISMFARQLRIDTHIKQALESDGNSAQAVKTLGINPYRAKHIERQIRSIPSAKLQECFLMCIDAEYLFKSGGITERGALDSLMLQISQRFQRNQSRK